MLVIEIARIILNQNAFKNIMINSRKWGSLSTNVLIFSFNLMNIFQYLAFEFLLRHHLLHLFHDVSQQFRVGKIWTHTVNTNLLRARVLKQLGNRRYKHVMTYHILKKLLSIWIIKITYKSCTACEANHAGLCCSVNWCVRRGLETCARKTFDKILLKFCMRLKLKSMALCIIPARDAVLMITPPFPPFFFPIRSKPRNEPWIAAHWKIKEDTYDDYLKIFLS